MIIYDHPFSGDIASGEILVDLGAALPDLLGPAADSLYVGPSLASYRFDGAVYGAPIDAATEHAAYRADLLATLGAPVPRDWEGVIALGRAARQRGLYLGAAIATPHAGLAAAALMANAGRAWSTDASAPFAIDGPALGEALDALAELAAFCPPEALAWNSIDLHDAMVARDDIAYAPCVYGYATYGEADMRRRLSFADFPGRRPPFEAGSAIGGTALGVAAGSVNREAALAFVRFALSAEAQDRIIPAYHGQPARLSAWFDADVDARFNGFFSGVRRSLETAWIRPRRAGYIPFQHEAGTIAARFLRGELGRTGAVSAILAAAERTGRSE